MHEAMWLPGNETSEGGPPSLRLFFACRPLMPTQQIHRSACCQISWEAQCLRPPYAVWAPL